MCAFNVKSVSENKKFWKTFKPFFSTKILNTNNMSIENSEMVRQEEIHVLFISNALFFFVFFSSFFLTQPQYCLTFKRIEPQMSLNCCLLFTDIILPRYAILCIFVSMSTSRFINYMIFFSLLVKTLAYLDIFAKSSASGCCLAFA